MDPVRLVAVLARPRAGIRLALPVLAIGYLLLLTGGGGVCGSCASQGYLEKNIEYFEPPYLFDAAGQRAVRPVLDSAPTAAGYAQDLDGLRHPRRGWLTGTFGRNQTYGETSRSRLPAAPDEPATRPSDAVGNPRLRRPSA